MVDEKKKKKLTLTASPKKPVNVPLYIQDRKKTSVIVEKRISKNVLKVLNAAISNAENNKQLDIDSLFVKEAYVGKSLSMKRFRPRAKGRASPIKKPFSRVTIILEEKKTDKREGEKK